MSTQTFERLSGEVEVDETYIGPRGQSIYRRHPELLGNKVRKGGKGPAFMKTTVMGFRQRDGKVRAFVVKDNRRNTLLPKVWENVMPGSTVYTDALGSYRGLRQSFVHKMINHAEKYVDGKVHTNSIESFWGVLKRTIGGTYICPRPKHLDAYL